MNETELKVRIDDAEFREAMKRAGDRASDWRPAAKWIAQEMTVRVDSVFARNRLGGTHRGVTWKYFAPQYTRKTDGAVVPAWGGVRKIRGRGNVKGRLRPSGQRIRNSDAVGQDTGHLRRAALTSRRLDLRRMVLGTNIAYAEHFASRRPFAFFHLPDDLHMAREKMIAYFNAGEAGLRG